MLAIGLMSGTSLDGVDGALVEINGSEFKLLKYILYPYDKAFKEKIMQSLNNQTAKLASISELNFELGHYFVRAIDKLLENTSYKYDDIAYVASHGQTIWHSPTSSCPNTFQIGEPSVITYETNITCISNFRTMDVAAGGEGAPLVPFSEYLLFKNYPKNLILQNIGGISNLTYLKKAKNIDDVIAFDCGVGNMMIDYFVNKYYHLPYDTDGNIASSGKIIDEILEYLKKDEFIYQKPPKSTGRERYSKDFFDEISEKLQFDLYNKEDIITTITEFTVYTISYNYKTFIKEYDEVIVSGGGSHNLYIMRRLKEELGKEVITSDEKGINSDAKEALCFAILGYETLHNRPSNLVSVTKAKKRVVLGNITLGKRGLNHGN